MGLNRTSLVLYILFVFHLQQHFHSVSSRPSSSVDTNHETLPFNDSKPDVLGFEGKARELAVVVKKGGGGGRGGGGRGGGSSKGKGGGGGSHKSRSHGGSGIIHAGGAGVAGSHRSSGSGNFRGTVCAVGWLAVSVLAGLLLV